jgi:membrane-associated phospholipid phosphatase
MRCWLTGITDLGDLAVLVPLAAAILIWLLRCFSRVAARWILALSICVGLTALLKIVFYGCPPAGDMHSPSGHANLSTLVYGALALTVAAAWPGLRRLIVISVGAGLILAIAVSRLLLDAHSNAPGIGSPTGMWASGIYPARGAGEKIIAALAAIVPHWPT